MLNFEELRTFNGGYVTDLVDSAEFKETYQKAVNGRLYSNNGTLAFCSVKGTKHVLNDPNIVKYLGYYAFKDELIVFVKSNKKITGTSDDGGLGTTVVNLVANNFSKVVPTPNTTITNVDSIEQNTTETITVIPPPPPVSSEIDFELNYSCVDDVAEEIDFTEYYQTDDTVPNLLSCLVTAGDTVIPQNNALYTDAIISISYDENGNLQERYLWVGYQNWDIKGKITTDGVFENEFYKRIYYTDVINPLRVVNIKDFNLPSKKGNEFDTLLKTTLLQPEIVSVQDGGELKSMKVLYVQRQISENGQVTEFSPSSFFASTYPEDSAISFRGGNVSEATGKSITVKVNIIDINIAQEVQVVAIEFEASGTPTAIRDLGRKPIGTVVEFTHFGNEGLFSSSLTLSDILTTKNTWKYAHDLSSKKNKLVVAGLRNDPVPSIISNMEYLFPLHSWNASGGTHDCLMNPKPWEFRYIDPSYEGKMIYVKRKLYRTIKVIGNFVLTFKNKATGQSFTREIFDSSNIYVDYTSIITDWLLDLESTEPLFNAYFPNLNVEALGEGLFMKPIDDSIITDFANYVFEVNTTQYIEDFENDTQFLPITVDVNNLVHGAVSAGFNEGNGIRVSYKVHKDEILRKATEPYRGTGKLVDYFTPSMKKGFFKGELYRLAFQAYDKDSVRLFSIPLGDIMIPEIGDMQTSIDDNGNSIITTTAYVNQEVNGSILYGVRVTLKIEVRLDCSLQDKLSMYQLLYVERNEDNRTILCQGISAPLNRVHTTHHPQHGMPTGVTNKWNLPYGGGPAYEDVGLHNFDIKGENYQTTGTDGGDRVISHRGLMYFDSPDIYYNKISTKYMNSVMVDIVGKLNTDHTADVIMESGEFLPSFGFGYGQEIYPKFSRKILHAQMNILDRPSINNKGRDSSTIFTTFVNFSVFARFTHYKKTHNIKKFTTMNRGETKSGSALDLQNDLHNGTFYLPNPSWYFGHYQRNWQIDDTGDANSQIFNYAIGSSGYPTIFLTTNDNLFTREFCGAALPGVSSQIRLGGTGYPVYDTIPLVNMFRNNRESVFGGRSRQNYSNNTYIPLSRTIPVRNDNNGTQFFEVEGDTYITLNMRTKNDHSDEIPWSSTTINNGGNTKSDYSDVETIQQHSAWTYGVVLETQVEPKLHYDYEFYRQSGIFNFSKTRNERINTCYFQENTFKKYIPKPFKFKDEPNMDNIVCTSEVKLSGEFFDAWTIFPVNNFYELEKNKGAVTNLAKQEEEIYAIQEHQTSLLYINRDELVNTASGSPIGVQQGSGAAISGHKVVSNFGTSIRRAVAETDKGFCFMDERKKEFVKMTTGMLLTNNLHLEWHALFSADPIIDTEAYHDEKYKETNIRIRTKSGAFYTLSYNEVMTKFNGDIKFNPDIFMKFDEKVFAPKSIVKGGVDNNNDLHELNEGMFLNFFDVQNTMKIGIIVNAQPNMVKIFKHFECTTNIGYHIKNIKARTSLDQTRTILASHDWYKIREGQHSVPLRNDTIDPTSIEMDDLRGKYIYLEAEIESINNTKIDIFAIVTHLRKSYI